MTRELPRRKALALRRTLLTWYASARRVLPWREEPSAYRVWVAEVMAQQTRIETVLPHYERFLARFPAVADLAAAPLDEVLALWSGLGYYARARNLHRAARIVVEQHGGQIPINPDILATLPGIGRYTAGAIASIAGGVPAPVLDGNVARVLSRLFDLAEDVTRGPARRRLWSLAEVLVRGPQPGDLNQALMELGALVCTPGLPHCPTCPVRRQCAALAAGTVLERPVRVAKRPPKAVRLVAACVRRGDGAVLLVRQPERGLFGGLWLPPLLPVDEVGSGRKARASALSRAVSFKIAVAKRLGRVEHVLTHRCLVVEVVSCTPEAPAPTSPDQRWIRGERDLARIGISTFVRKILALCPSGIR